MISAWIPFFARGLRPEIARLSSLPGGFDVSMRTYCCKSARAGVIVTGLGIHNCELMSSFVCLL